MKEDELKELLKQYVEQQMSLVVPEKIEVYETSKKFKKRIKRLFWSEKYFGKQVRLGNAVRKVAILAMLVGSLVIAGEVSAKIFGFSPWEFIMNYLEDSKMEERIYKKPRKNEDRQVVNKMPTYIPEGYLENVREENDFSVYIDWLKGEDSGIQYGRVDISEDLSISTDAEYNSKRKVEVAGYAAYIYKKGNEMWLDWDDERYNYHIYCVELNNSEEELLKMANSLYDQE